MRKSILAAALSLLVLPAATAFAGEGSFQPQAVLSPASGPAVHAPVGGSFVYSQGEGGQADASPSIAAIGPAAPGPTAGTFTYNAGLNG